MSQKPRLPLLVGTCLIIAALLLSVLPGRAARAQSITRTFKPAADAYVVQTFPSTNYGIKTTLLVDGSPVTRAYLRFIVSGLNSAAIQSAKIRLYANSSNTTGFTVNALSNTTWAETTLTYSNAPAPAGAIKQSAAFNQGQWATVDVSSYVKTEGTYNLVLTTTSVTNSSLASRESGANAPQLVVVTGTAAPTATKPLAPTNTPTKVYLPTVTQMSGDAQPTFPIRATFYYPWFPEAWTQQGIYPYTSYTPSLGYYSSGDLSIIKKHIQMMQYAHIQAGIASWWGQGSHTDTKIPGLLSTAAGTSFRWALYYELESPSDPTAAQIRSDLTYIRVRYGKDPSFLRVNGKFVVFVYASPGDGCGMADRWKQGNTVGAFVVLKVFPGYASCASQPDSWHQYSPAVAADQQGSYSYTISPGFWLKGQSVRLPRDITRWTQNVKDMVASRTNWELVTTFSEWGEGTAIEPAAEWSSASGYGQYLDVLHTYGQ